MIERSVQKMERLLRINANKVAQEISLLQAKRLISPDKYGSQLLRNQKLLKAIADQFYSLEGQLLFELNEMTADQWNLANEKNTILTKSFVGKVEKQYAHLNLQALAAFQQRFENGITLSARIHNLTEFNMQLYKDYIGTGITQGKSSISIARELNKINANPENVTVFDKMGEPVKLSKISPILQPGAKGSGIYKSPLKNLYRVTRTETNKAYRISDHTRIQQLDFVVGYEVHLSASHNLYDMCDWLKGQYPKTFKFSGWHPNCFCYVTTILKTKKEFKDKSPISRNQINRIPKSAQRYVKTKDMSYYDWHKDNFTKNNIPKKKVGGPDKGIKPYKVSVDAKDYLPKPKILVDAAKSLS